MRYAFVSVKWPVLLVLGVFLCTGAFFLGYGVALHKSEVHTRLRLAASEVWNPWLLLERYTKGGTQEDIQQAIAVSDYQMDMASEQLALLLARPDAVCRENEAVFRMLLLVRDFRRTHGRLHHEFGPDRMAEIDQKVEAAIAAWVEKFGEKVIEDRTRKDRHD